MRTIKLLCLGAAAFTLTGQLVLAGSSGTGFTYQGRLFIGDVPANGLYDLQFTNYDAAAGGTALGGFNTNALPVTNGLFTVTLDFGAVFDGTPRWLEISERTNTVGAFGTLAPRQLLAAAPYATYAASAGSVPGLTILQNSSGAPNVVAGSPLNWVASGVVGATIAGGGASNYDGHIVTNSVSADFGTIGGGNQNTIQTEANWATIGGGDDNTIQNDADVATIGGGSENTISNWSGETTIAGGFQNVIQPYVTAGTIGGGNQNKIQTQANWATIGGGAVNTIQDNDEHATISGGSYNTIQANAIYATIGGGKGNVIGNNSLWATIGGGSNNTIQASASNSTIGGGDNDVIQTAADHATIGGGWANTVQTSAAKATIGGGEDNAIWASADHATIGGGYGNVIQQNAYYATIPGGYENIAANYAFAAGNHAQAVHTGAFVWADSSGGSFSSTANNQFAARAIGGFAFFTSVSGGATLATGSGSWTSMSDRNAKENFAPLDPQSVLAKVAALPLTTWNYKAQDPAIRHLGPMAQDFKAAFGLGETDTGITGVDADGVALAAIQGLNQKLEETRADNAALRADNADLKARLEKLERLLKPSN